MILDFLINAFFGILDVLLTPIGLLTSGFNDVCNFVVDSNVFQYFALAQYLLPMDKLAPLFVIIVSFYGLKYGIVLFKFIWSLIPFKNT